ncbi:MAG: hypothetical protein ABL986_10665 [Vicinamibacterales bacterium]
MATAGASLRHPVVISWVVPLESVAVPVALVVPLGINAGLSKVTSILVTLGGDVLTVGEVGDDGTPVLVDDPQAEVKAASRISSGRVTMWRS